MPHAGVAGGGRRLTRRRAQAKALLNVHDLTVLSSYRRQGVGRALLQAVIAAAEAEGCGKVTLEMGSNAKARALYESMGFDLSLVFGEKRLDGSVCLGAAVH